jgi:hypothetical protein
MRYRGNSSAQEQGPPMVTDSARVRVRDDGRRAYTTPMIHTMCRAQTHESRADVEQVDISPMMLDSWY